MPKGLRRRYGLEHLHFITCSCDRRLPLLSSARARNTFVKILGEVRDRCGFSLVGYVVMPDHIHLLLGERARGTPSTVIQVLKQRASRRLRRKRKSQARQLPLDFQDGHTAPPLHALGNRKRSSLRFPFSDSFKTSSSDEPSKPEIPLTSSALAP